MPRDNFTKKTKELVAKRVAYRCCFKGCGIATIGPKCGDASKTSNIGVACHIYAASPDGPRYNPNMTTKERTSPDNCIWMCQTHSKLIDTDEKAYSPTLLQEWKENAEKEAADRLKYYQYSQAELSDKRTLESIFETLIQDGQYDVLIMLIEQLKMSNSIDELLLRYEVIYNCYCNRNALPANIKHYIEAKVDKKFDSIIKVLISLNLKIGLQELIPYCQDDELKKWAEAILNGTIQDVLFCPVEQVNETKKQEIKDKTTASHLLSSVIVENRMLSLPKQSDGTTFVLQEKDFLFKVRAYSWRVFCKSYNGEDFIKDERISEEYVALKNSFSKIIQLDKEFQTEIWVNCLNYVIHDKKEFEQIYHLCPNYITTDIRCKRVYIYFSLLYNLEDLNNYLNDNEVINDESTLLTVLQNIDNNIKDQFLDDHKYLLRKSSSFLFLWTQNEVMSEQEKYKILLKYQKYYATDFLWNCMVSYYAERKEGGIYLQWAKEHLSEMPLSLLELYINSLKKYEEWEELKKLFPYVRKDRFRYMIIIALCTNNTAEYNLYCVELFKQLANNNFYEKLFYRNFAVLLYRTGDIAQAKKYYEKEYDLNPNNIVLLELLQVKHDCNDFKIDKYVEVASKENNADLQYTVSAFYGLNNEFDLQKKHIIRSLLINPSNAEAFNVLATVYLRHPDEDEFKMGKIYKLKNGDEIVSVAVLGNNLTDNISCQVIMGCEVVDEDNPKYISWNFLEINDEVNYNGCTYTIIEITSFSERLFDEAFAFVLKNGTMKQISGKSPEDAINELVKLVKSRESGQQKLFNIFNESKGILPVTLLSRHLGVDYYTTWGHIICKNKLKLNNYSNGNGVYYIMSNDAICTLGILEAIKDIEVTSLILAKQTKANILSMFSSKINDLQGGSVGSLQIENGQVYKTDYDKKYKKGALSFFGKLLAFVDDIKGIEAKPFLSQQQDITNFFIQENLSSERYLLGLAQNNEQYIVVTDEPFVCTMCDLEKIPHISTIDFLFNQNLNHSKILKYLNILDSFNFLNYFSPCVYKKIVDSVKKVDAEKRKEFLVELQKWLVPEKRSKEHSYRVFNTYRELLEEDSNSFYSHTLSKIGRFYFSELFPEKYQEFIDQFKNIRIEIVPLDDGGEE